MLVEWFLDNAGDHQGLAVAVPDRAQQIAVHLPDELEGDLLGAYGFTFAMIRATAEAFVRHGDHHAERPLIALKLTLQQRIEINQFRRGEQHDGSIRTGGDARSTADARRRVKRRIRRLLGDQDRVSIERATRGRADEATRLNDAVK